MTSSGVNNEMLQAVKTEIERQSQHEIPDPGHGLTWLEGYFNLKEILEAAFVVKGGALPDWEYVAKAFFKTEKHLTADQAWFDFQAKAQRFLEVLKAEMPPQPIPTPDEALREGRLLPCPFCGGTKLGWMRIRDGVSAVCNSRGCGARISAFDPNAQEKATALWNTRVAALSRARPEEDKSWTDMTSEQVKRLDMRAIEKIFRETARKQRAHESITNENALDLVNIVAIHGDRLADAIGLFFHAERARPHSHAPSVDEVEMREMIGTAVKSKMPAWWAVVFDKSDRKLIDVECALAFGRALLEKKP